MLTFSITALKEKTNDIVAARLAMCFVFSIVQQIFEEGSLSYFEPFSIVVYCDLVTRPFAAIVND